MKLDGVVSTIKERDHKIMLIESFFVQRSDNENASHISPVTV